MALANRGCVLVLGASWPPPYGGIARYLHRALPHLAARGFRVVAVQAAAHAVQDPPQNPVEGLDVQRITRPTLRSLVRYSLTHPRLTFQLLSWYAYPLRRDPLRGGRAMLASLAWIVHGDACLQTAQGAVVHAYDFPWEQGAAAVLLARQFGVRSVISTFGELVPHRGELDAYEGLDTYAKTTRQILEEADKVVSMTAHCQTRLAIVGFDPRQAERVRMVVDMEAFHPSVSGARVRSRYGFGSSTVLLFVGQMRARKGPQVLLSCLPQLVTRFPDCRLLMVGPDHNYLGYLKRLAEDLELSEIVSFAGQVTDDELPEYYAACDALVFPSITEIECLGLSFVQAMFSAKPVIVTSLGGAREVVRDGIDGWFVEPGSADDLSEKTSRLLELPKSIREQMGSSARERALSLFQESSVLAEIEHLYSTLLAEQ